jgi:hypothetical protein
MAERKSYALRSSQFSGHLIFAYDEEGRLTEFRLEAGLSAQQHQYLLDAFPATLGLLLALCNSSKTLRLEALPEDLSFDRFWDAYDYKVARRKAEALWARLSQGERKMALDGIKPYDNWVLKKNLAKCYPETYLRNRRWEDSLK